MEYLHRLVDKVVQLLPWTPSGPVAMLAERYDCASDEERERFLADLRSRLQFVYRAGLDPPLRGAGGRELASDSGWGCMLRATQMMLAQAFASLTLGRAWRLDRERDHREGSAYRDIIACFLDIPGAPFSLHRLVAEGQRLSGKEPGTWFGPTSAAQAVGKLFETLFTDEEVSHKPEFLRSVACVPFEDGAIVKSAVLEKFDQGSTAVLLLVCKRLGLEGFNVAEYRAGVERCFELPEFQGLASGNNGTSAHYFVATHGDSLVYLDPHWTLPSLRTVELALADGSGLHPERPLHLWWERLNPSVCFSFLVRSCEEFGALCQTLSSGALESVFEVLERPLALGAGCAALGGDQSDEDVVLVQ